MMTTAPTSQTIRFTMDVLCWRELGASEAGRRTSAWPRVNQSRPCRADALCVGERSQSMPIALCPVGRTGQVRRTPLIPRRIAEAQSGQIAGEGKGSITHGEQPL
jgi:hypothetical protein